MKGIHVSIIGLIAGTLTTISFLPQIIKIIVTKHVRDISLSMYIVFTTGIVIWLVYGILLGELPLILANCIGFIFCSFIIFMKFKYGKKD